MFISRHTLKWTKTCRSSGDFPHAHTAHFLLNRHSQKTVSGFPHVAWRTAGDIAHRVAERLKAAIPSPFDHLTLIGVDETSYRKGHTYITVVVDHERHRVI